MDRETMRSYDELFRNGTQLVNADALWKLMTAHKALVAEKQQLRDKAQRVLDAFEATGFEEDSEALLALCDLRDVLVLAGTPSEDTG